MSVLVMWLGLVLLIGGLCFAAASGAFTKKKTHRTSRGGASHPRLRRAAKLMVLIGILLWLFGALFTAATTGR